MIFNGQAIDLPHNFIILIDKSSHSLDLLEFKFLINAKISSSLILRVGGVLSVLSRSVGKLLEFYNWVHCDAKYLLNIVAFWEKFEIIFPSTFLLLRRRFNIFEYVWGAARGSFSFSHICLTLSWRRPLSYRNQSIDLLCKSVDWFLYENGLRHERLNIFILCYWNSLREFTWFGNYLL